MHKWRYRIQHGPHKIIFFFGFFLQDCLLIFVNMLVFSSCKALKKGMINTVHSKNMENRGWLWLQHRPVVQDGGSSFTWA